MSDKGSRSGTEVLEIGESQSVLIEGRLALDETSAEWASRPHGGNIVHPKPRGRIFHQYGLGQFEPVPYLTDIDALPPGSIEAG